MQLPFRRILRYSISFLFAIVFLYLAFREVKLIDLLNSLKGANYWWVFSLIPLYVLMSWIRVERWATLLAPIKTNVSKRTLFSGVMIGYAINNVLPRVGEIVRPYLVGRREGISVSSTLATIVVERILDFMSFFFITCIVLFIYPNSLDPFVENPSLMRPIFLLGSFASLIIFILLFFRAEAFFRVLGKLFQFAPKKYSAKINHILEAFYTGFAVSKIQKNFWLVLLQSFIIWGINALIMYAPFYAFDALIKPEMNFGASIVLLVVSSIAWILPAPGAMGTYHSFLTVAMIKLYNIDLATSLSYAIVTHEIGFIVITGIGAYYYFRDQFKITDLTKESS